MKKENLLKFKTAAQLTAMTVANVAVTMPMIVNADGDTGIGGSIWNVADQILSIAQTVLFPILAIMTIFYGIKIFVASDAKSVQEAKGNAIRCAIGAFIVLFAPTIVSAISNAVNSAGANTKFDRT